MLLPITEDRIELMLDPAGQPASRVWLSCINSAGVESPTFTFEYTVPGTPGEARAVEISTSNSLTPAAADTVLLVYDGSCRTSTSVIACSDGPPGTDDTRAELSVSAVAGEVLTVVMAYSQGFNEYARPPIPVQLTIESRPNRPPTLETAHAVSLEDSLFVSVTASDPDGPNDIFSIETTLRDAQGGLVIEDSLDNPMYISRALVTMARGEYHATQRFAQTLPADAASVTVRVIDRGDAPSAQAVTVPIVRGTTVDLGDACDVGDRGPRLCRDELTCTSGMCAPSAEAAAACEGATTVMLTPDGAGVSSARLSTRVTAGTGIVPVPTTDECRFDIGSTEVPIHVVGIPANSDLIVESTASVSRETDTVLYARSDCTNPSTTLGCNDDFGSSLTSRLELMDAPTTLTVFAEHYQYDNLDHPFDLTFRARPVRQRGQACDPAGQVDRCANEPCATTRTCP